MSSHPSSLHKQQCWHLDRSCHWKTEADLTRVHDWESDKWSRFHIYFHIPRSLRVVFSIQVVVFKYSGQILYVYRIKKKNDSPLGQIIFFITMRNTPVSTTRLFFKTSALQVMSIVCPATVLFRCCLKSWDSMWVQKKQANDWGKIPEG